MASDKTGGEQVEQNKTNEHGVQTPRFLLLFRSCYTSTYTFWVSVRAVILSTHEQVKTKHDNCCEEGEASSWGSVPLV